MRLLFLVPAVIVIIYAAIIIALLVFCIINKKWRRRNNFRRIAMMAVSALILARPVFLNGFDEMKTNNLSLFFIVDMSGSMAVKDQNDDTRYRYEQVSDDIKNIANAFPGSHYSMISLDTGVYTSVPVSTNLDTVRQAADALMPKNSNYGTGTDLNELLNYSANRIKSFGKKNPSLMNIVFFFSDGEDTTGSTISIGSSFKNNIGGGAVFGYGSENGGVVHKVVNNTLGNNRSTEISDSCIKYYGSNALKDSSYCAISQMDEDNLKKISNQLGVEYYHRQDDSIPASLINEIKKNIRYDGDETTDGYIDIYWLLAILLLGLLIWDFYDSFNKILLERSRKNA